MGSNYKLEENEIRLRIMLPTIHTRTQTPTIFSFFSTKMVNKSRTYNETGLLLKSGISSKLTKANWK